MTIKLDGLKVAILTENGFEQVEMTEPRKALDEAGAKTFLISPQNEKVRGMHSRQWSDDEFNVDIPLDETKPDEYDALLLPGGSINPDILRTNPKAVTFVKDFFDKNKPVAAICHGLWTIVEADKVRGRKLTSWPSLKTDIRNAGGNWEDNVVVVDGNLVTSRKPEDIPAFNEEMIKLFLKSVH